MSRLRVTDVRHRGVAIESSRWCVMKLYAWIIAICVFFTTLRMGGRWLGTNDSEQGLPDALVWIYYERDGAVRSWTYETLQPGDRLSIEALSHEPVVAYYTVATIDGHYLSGPGDILASKTWLHPGARRTFSTTIRLDESVSRLVLAVFFCDREIAITQPSQMAALSGCNVKEYHIVFKT